MCLRIAGTLLCFSLCLLAETKIVATGLAEPLVKDLQSAAPSVRIVAVAGRPQLLREIADADAVIGAVRPEEFKAAKKLKWVHVGSAGVENALFPEIVESDVIVTNQKNVYGPQIADHAFAFLLALTRRLNVTIPTQVNEDWARGREGMVELNGKTAVIIGAGGIGGNIAQRAKAFGMRVIAVDPRDLSASSTLDLVVPPDRLDSVLPQADVVFVAAPHTKKSEGMMGAKQFDLLKKGAYFVSVSRGKLTKTDALVKALDSGRLAGAGLDVTDPEPLPKGHALWKFKNVVITAHTAGGSDRLDERVRALLLENVKRFAAGEPLLNVVNKREGY
jgi:phosphoglycerate dehydrogenase-like enzyme